MRQTRQEFRDFFAVDRNRHPGAVIAHPPLQPELLGEPPDVRPKANALNQTANTDQADSHWPAGLFSD
jgi:hypothetical protein